MVKIKYIFNFKSFFKVYFLTITQIFIYFQWFIVGYGLKCITLSYFVFPHMEISSKVFKFCQSPNMAYIIFHHHKKVDVDTPILGFRAVALCYNFLMVSLRSGHGRLKYVRLARRCRSNERGNSGRKQSYCKLPARNDDPDWPTKYVQELWRDRKLPPHTAQNYGAFTWLWIRQVHVRLTFW